MDKEDRDTVSNRVREFRAAIADFNRRLRAAGFFAALESALDERGRQ